MKLVDLVDFERETFSCFASFAVDFVARVISERERFNRLASFAVKLVDLLGFGREILSCFASFAVDFFDLVDFERERFSRLASFAVVKLDFDLLVDLFRERESISVVSLLSQLISSI